MHYLLWHKRKIILLVMLVATSLQGFTQRQMNRPDHDDLAYYFGITLGYNSSYLAPTKSSRFIQNDSILVAEPGASGGITLGLSATGRLSDRFQIRANPQLVLGGARSFNYILNNPAPGENIVQKKMLPSTLISLPIHFKFNSDRIDNFRFYALAGGRIDKDLSSNSNARNAEDLIKLKPIIYSLEAGIGFNFFLPFVTISPEIKFTYGGNNIHARDANLKYSSVFDRIESRMISFSIHFED